MLDEHFRRGMQRTAAAPARWMHRLGVTPNMVTVAAYVLGLAAAVLVARGHASVGISVWIASRVLDGYDGILARLSGRATLFGGFLDISLDMLAYSSMAVAFAVARPEQWTLWMIVLVGYVMAITTTLALSSLLERADRTLGGDRSLQFTPALAEGGETSIVYVAVVLLPGWAEGILWGWIALLALTALGRVRLAARLLG
ncbi:MAG: CDP-alcohol phosphatidyltransferase family protein [Gemmatimonadaceae bacterium]|nr:CDP-alcohol phosphatidyltransferase family protein [Gemmatimonadaceae bacterium]